MLVYRVAESKPKRPARYAVRFAGGRNASLVRTNRMIAGYGGQPGSNCSAHRLSFLPRVVRKGGGRIQRRAGSTSASPKHQALCTTRRRGRRGSVGRCDGRDRKQWDPLRSPGAVVFPESRGGSSCAAFRPLAMTIVAGESRLW